MLYNVEKMGVFGLTWEEIVLSDLVRQGTGYDKKKLDQLIKIVQPEYNRNVKNGLFPVYVSGTVPAAAMVRDIVQKTGIPAADVALVLDSIERMAKAGKINRAIYIPRDFFAPVKAAAVELEKKTTGIFNKVLIVAGIGATAYFLIPKLLTMKGKKWI